MGRVILPILQGLWLKLAHCARLECKRIVTVNHLLTSKAACEHQTFRAELILLWVELPEVTWTF